MSLIAGTVAGALAAGGVYYGFSNLMQTRTDQHRSDLHRLSNLLISPPLTSTGTPVPPPASERIQRNELSSYIKGRWNEGISGLFGTVNRWERDAGDVGRKWVYGGESERR